LKFSQTIVVTGFWSSHLFQRVASFLLQRRGRPTQCGKNWFSSLSESGFIPTNRCVTEIFRNNSAVLISFREWLHSYQTIAVQAARNPEGSSHLFQRVASFLRRFIDSIKYLEFEVLISFREWLHSYIKQCCICMQQMINGSHLFQRVASFLLRPESSVIELTKKVLISFREWLHSYLRPSVSLFF